MFHILITFIRLKIRTSKLFHTTNRINSISKLIPKLTVNSSSHIKEFSFKVRKRNYKKNTNETRRQICLLRLNLYVICIFLSCNSFSLSKTFKN